MPSTSLATRKRERGFCLKKIPRSREKSLQGVWIFLLENSEQQMEALSQKATRMQPHSVGRGHEHTDFRAYLYERDRRGTWEWAGEQPPGMRTPATGRGMVISHNLKEASCHDMSHF